MNKKILLLFLIFTLIQLPLVFYSNIPADEWVYFAVTKEVSKGHQLYTEIFFSHPPFQIYVYSLFSNIFGFHIWLLKSITLSFAIGCAVFVYLISKERYGEKIAFWSLLIFLTSYDLLIFGSFAFGIEIAVFFFLASFYYLNKKNIWSGALFALCIMSRLHLAILGVVLFLYSKEKIKFLIGSSISLIYYIPLVTIPQFMDNVFNYHLVKSFFFNGWLSFFKANIHLFLLLGFSIRKLRNEILIFIGVTYLLFMLLMKSVFEYYFLVVTAVLCIEGAVCLIKSKQKNLLRFVVIIWIFLLIFRATPFLINQTKGYNEFTDYINTLEDKDLVGQSAVTSMLALRTNRNISKNQIDTNFQRKKIYDYSNAIVIYEEGIFKGNDFNCSRLNIRQIEDKKYEVWDC